MSTLIANNHISTILLVGLTFISVWLAQSTIEQNVLVILVTLSVMVKGQLIVDTFMELYQAPNKWRYVLLSYVVLVPLILAIIIYS
ncbi:hypothetical protein NBRC116592_10090 [Colwellia sp. KU-HH00111]|uniref:cytochrome C oxidase subunit IV family protein n=1 Tax=Colwellia sp. KU-HH00111 TaxID=3127652 RepID=UPI003102F406